MNQPKYDYFISEIYFNIIFLLPSHIPWLMWSSMMWCDVIW